ncbi:MAG: DUF4831 family protein [Bacteroidales bacterium]|nr:DUF4831 family protein [Bacteroidales bacterium]
MRYSRILFVAMPFVVLACTKNITVKPIGSAELKAEGVVYALPRTVLSITVEESRVVTIPGPYSQFASKYLGISDVPTVQSEEHTITGISIRSTVESDPSALYAASLDKSSVLDFFQVINSGLILPVTNFTAQSPCSSLFTNGVRESFTDLSVSPFIVEEKTTFYSKVQRDSSFVRIPVQKSMIIERNLEEKAKEAADLIFSLRKKRMEFMTIDVDQPLSGDALAVLFNQIDALEKEYLALFVGKQYAESVSRHILYTPTNPEGETNIAFRFSASRGVVAANDMSGNPILLQLEPEALPEIYSQFFKSIADNASKNRFNQVYYRIPVNAVVRLSDGKTDLATHRLPIYQYGPTAILPIKQLLVK